MNIVYNASAGTGKTYQVTSLYEKLVLEQDVDPREILLMTFTDNAAAELRDRVAHRLQKARRDAEAADDFDAAERAIIAMSRLPSAPISTIHAYCARLLREHALEAGLSPAFKTLTGEERDELLNRISRDTLLKQLSIDRDFRAFCEGVQMIGLGGGFGSSVTETAPKLINEAGSLGLSLESAAAMLPDPEPPVAISEFATILRRLEELSKKTKKINEAITALRTALEQCTDAEQLIELFDQNFSGHFTVGEAKPISHDFKELKEAVINRERYRQRYPAAKAFARYVQSVATEFQSAKRNLDAVDFDDLLRMAAELLAGKKVNPAFKHVIVDEVQDTSRVQCQLIQALWSDETHLVICGDKKQSIYTWRGADPQVMPDLETAICERDGTFENLKTSYRSKAPIIKVLNELFEMIYEPEHYTANDQLAANSDFETTDEKLCVEHLRFDGDEELPKGEKVTLEMEAVAGRIRSLVHGGDNWRPNYRYADGFQSVSEENTYRYSDILILLRRTAHQSTLEEALRHAGVPYTLGGKGAGLFARQETRDVSLFLNAITNPKDVYSLVGFLRSPWIGMSDEAIAELSIGENGFSFEALTHHEIERITRYRALLATKLASELVRSLIEETGYDALLAGLPRGEQRLANLRKVLDWLREAERGARITPAQVARMLAERITNPPKTAEAAILDPNQNAVTIMTVHGSKGLTKRVVFLPDTSSRTQHDTAFARLFLDEDKQPKLGVKITAADRTDVKSPGFNEANERAKAVREHESKNLFYVAMTRARDLVVTSASVGKKSEGWHAWLEPMINNSISAIPYADLATESTPLPEQVAPSKAALSAAVESIPAPPDRPALTRTSATRLAKETTPSPPHPHTPVSEATSANLGSLGHAVLEQLALNGWAGSVADWLERLRSEFGIDKKEAAGLEQRIEATRDLANELTAQATHIHPELPFVLHDGEQLIDGTIDLLCETTEGFAIYDYKFTEADDEAVSTAYRRQMEIYRKAAERKISHTEVAESWFIVISNTGPRLLEMDF